MLSQAEIKYINSLKVKKYRNKYSEFIAEGDKIIKELIIEGLVLTKLFVVKNTFENEPCVIISDKELNTITTLVNHHNSLAIFKIPISTIHINQQEWIVLLDDIQDPGNMGTIIRTCDWFGIKQIICSEGCVDVYNPKVVQASMASVGRVQIMETNLLELIQHHKMPIYGAVLNGKNYNDISFKEKGFILIGNEGHGINEKITPKITIPITIPKKGKAESLNAAIATALILDKLT